MPDELRLDYRTSGPVFSKREELVVWAKDDGTLHTTDQDGTDSEVGAAVLPSAYAHFREQQANGVGPGWTPSSATWNTRPLNTEVLDADGIATLASNQITLGAALYQVRGGAYALNAGRTKLRIRDITNTATLLTGGNLVAGGVDASLWVMIDGRFTLAGTAAIELQHYFETGGDTYRCGAALSTGEVEVFSEIHIEKIA